MPDIPLMSIRWQIDSVSTPPPGRRSVAEVAPDPHLAAVVGDRFEVEKEFRATSPQRRGAEPLPPLDVTIPTEPGAAYLLAVRQEGSGALSFHAPKKGPERRGATPTGAPGTATFEIEFPEDVDEGTRRSILTKTIKGVVLKAAGKFADLTVPWVGSEVEGFIWKKKGLLLGWLQVTKDGLASGQLQAADFSAIGSPADRCLLLLHGTFSNAAGAFQTLATIRAASGRDFFSALAPIYGNRIYAFNHFTVSETPEKNAADLLAGLPKQATFDVVTHSRGGLVLRNLVERHAALGTGAAKFQLGQAVLVASPNIGTPLATADRFDKLISWWANILELFPENPVSTTIEYIGEALTFIARHVVDALPGLEAMDMAGDPISVLNTKSAAPPAPAYSAITSNHRPQGPLLARMLDLGIDGIFGMANDLVVPTTGAWKTEAHPFWVPGARIGCFGINLNSASAKDGVIHTTYFSQPETVDFVLETFLSQPLGLQPVDLDINPPFFLRRSLTAAATVAAASVPQTVPAPGMQTRDSQGFLPTALNEADNILQLFLISPDDYLPPEAAKVSEGRTAILLATYRNARVVETIYLRRPRGAKPPPAAEENWPADDSDTYHWNKIIGTNEQIKNYVDGKADAKPPTEDQLLDLGVNLFNAMLPGTVRRLYDVARIDRARAVDRRRLDIVITSMINWVADKPWEFAYDPNRETFLATEAVNFTRNVLTAVPAEEFVPHPDKPLRMLVVVAQPVGMALLSAAEEEQVVRRGFQELEDLGLATVEYMMRARIDQLHERLRNPDIDILHFIGHGTYQKDAEGKEEGYLVFESPDGSMQLVSAESLRQVLCQRGIRLIFLNACETGMVGRTQLKFDFNRGVAPKLVAGGIPVLVANQYKVLDVSATEFAKHFYRWLALGATTRRAKREWR